MLKRTRFVALGLVAFLAVPKDASAECSWVRDSIHARFECEDKNTSCRGAEEVVQTATLVNATSGTRNFSLACGTNTPSNFSLEPDASYAYTCRWRYSCGGDKKLYISFAPSPRAAVQRRQLYNGMRYNFGRIGNDIELFMMVF